MIEDEFEDSSSSSDGDEELIIKPPQSSELDSVLHHKGNKRRHSEDYKCCKKHHHHHRHHHHHHYHSDSSSKYQNTEDKSFHYTDDKHKNKEFKKNFTDLEMIGNRSKKLMKTITECDKEKNVKPKEVTDVRDIKFVKEIKDNRKYRNEERSTHFFEEMKAEWRNKRLLWLQRQKYHDVKQLTEKEGLQDKKCENCAGEKNVTDHIEIDDEKQYTLISLVSSEDENMDCEEKDKKENKSVELVDEKKDTVSAIDNDDKDDTSKSVLSDKDSIRTESSSESENVLQEETMSLEIAKEATVVSAVIKENLTIKPVEENEIPSVSKEKSPFQEPSDVYIPQLPVYCPAIQGCRSIDGFQVLNRIEEGTYGVVYRARDKDTKEIVALKRLKMEREKEGFPITSLREINTLLKAQHPNIVTVREIVVGSNMDRIYIVMDYVEHDLKSLMKTMPRPFLIGEVKTLLRQLLCAVAHLHDNWILHRDLKTSNLLLSHEGILKVGDFGLAREYGSPLKSYTPVVVTLWYRAPELLLGAKKYSTSIDIWSVGCIFGELLTKNALFPGKSESDQINRIFKDLGTPNENIWPGYSQLPLVQSLNITQYPYNNLKSRFSRAFSDLGFDLLNRFLTYNPARRISAEKAISHEFFNEKPKPIPSNMFPTWPARSEREYRSARSSPKPPLGGIHYSRQ